MAPDSPPPEVMWTIARIAERDGIVKQTVSEHVKRLVERHGLTVERDARGRVALVNVVAYDTLRARYADPAKAQAPRLDLSTAPAAAPAPSPTGPAKNSYDEAVRQRAWHDVEKRRMEVGEMRGRLVRADRYAAAVARCSDELVRIFDQLPQDADALALDLGLDDMHGLRIALKGLARRLRTKLADAFDALAAEAPALDEPIVDDEEGGDA